jgi:hypothetical protein
VETIDSACKLTSNSTLYNQSFAIFQDVKIPEKKKGTKNSLPDIMPMVDLNNLN